MDLGLLQEGQILRDTYEIERYLGEGAFAEVYRVKHRFLGRQAMKVFKLPGLTLQELETMLGEAVLLSRINHPNIVRLFDANVFSQGGQNHGFFTMEYVAGGIGGLRARLVMTIFFTSKIFGCISGPFRMPQNQISEAISWL